MEAAGRDSLVWWEHRRRREMGKGMLRWEAGRKDSHRVCLEMGRPWLSAVVYVCCARQAETDHDNLSGVNKRYVIKSQVSQVAQLQSND